MTIRIALVCDAGGAELAHDVPCEIRWTSSSLDPALTAEEANANGWRRHERADGTAADLCPACLAAELESPRG